MSLKISLPLPTKVKCPHLLRVHRCALSPNAKMKGWTNRSWSEEVMVVSLLSPQYHHLPRTLAWAWEGKGPVPSSGLKPDLLPSQLLGTALCDMAYPHPAG